MPSNRSGGMALVASVVVVLLGLIGFRYISAGPGATTFPETTASTVEPLPPTSDTVTTALPTSTTWLEAPSIPLRAYLFTDDGERWMVLDFETGEIQPEAPSPVAAVDGAVVANDRSLLMWAGGRVQHLQRNGDLQVYAPASLGGNPTAMRVVPAPDNHAWIVQPGSPTLIDLVGLGSGERLIVAESEPNLSPAGGSSSGLLVADADGRVMLYTYSGVLVPVGEGEGLAGLGDAVAWLGAAGQDGYSELLVANSLTPADRFVIPAPEGAAWTSASGPFASTPTIRFQAFSPDLSKLVVGWADPPRLVVVDVDSGESRVLSEGVAPVAAWSSDGRWVVSFEGRTVRLYDQTNPEQSPVSFPDVIPDGFHPYAAG